jgi:hypothetical protein
MRAQLVLLLVCGRSADLPAVPSAHCGSPPTRHQSRHTGHRRRESQQPQRLQLQHVELDSGRIRLRPSQPGWATPLQILRIRMPEVTCG